MTSEAGSDNYWDVLESGEFAAIHLNEKDRATALFINQVGRQNPQLSWHGANLVTKIVQGLAVADNLLVVFKIL